MHASTWDSLIEEADRFVESSCATAELRQRYKLTYWIVTHAKQFEQVFESCVSNSRQSPHNAAVVTSILSCVDITPGSVVADVVACD